MSQPKDEPALRALQSLLETMRTLRSPEGCEWDRQQSPGSLRKYILEEAYEVVDALDRGQTEEICEELGDLLLQVVFQAQIFAEQGAFSMTEVATSIDSKLKRRHPHIFADADPASLDSEWERIKREERTGKGQSLCLDSRIPKALPALKRATKLISVLQRESRQPLSSLQATRQITGYLAELGGDSFNQNSAEQQLGNLLFQVVTLARSLGVDAEEALRQTVDRRIKDHDTANTQNGQRQR